MPVISTLRKLRQMALQSWSGLHNKFWDSLGYVEGILSPNNTTQHKLRHWKGGSLEHLLFCQALEDPLPDSGLEFIRPTIWAPRIHCKKHICIYKSKINLTHTHTHMHTPQNSKRQTDKGSGSLGAFWGGRDRAGYLLYYVGGSPLGLLHPASEFQLVSPWSLGAFHLTHLITRF